MNNIAVIIPCYNEDITIGRVIEDFARYLPEAKIYVFDNNSTDRTADIAKSAGAVVIKEKRQGKGFVIQAMFKKIDADIYVMVDGDDTYEISKITEAVNIISNDEADMVTGNRLKTHAEKSFRLFHAFGNKVVRGLINKLFKARLKDIMTGYRIMNRAFVKNINITSSGFEVETEMTIKALKYGYVIKEVDLMYRERPAGSQSKLNTFTDGMLVLKTIFIIFKEYKPLVFFSILSGIMLLISLFSGWVVVDEFIRTRYITHVPLAIFATGSMILSIISLVTGIILDSVNRRFNELYNFMVNKG
jgi:glycosyltransferase involved in cell wall biosynthesis